MSWSPANGTLTLIQRLGKRETLGVLVTMLVGEVSGAELAQPFYREVLLDIGNGHADRLLDDPTGTRLAYWPRVWAARSLAYLGEIGAVESLIEALTDPHWRVRMTAVQTLGRLGAEGVTSSLVAALDDGHRRVRGAAVVALGRVGDEEALERLSGLLHTAKDYRTIEYAINKIEHRIRN